MIMRAFILVSVVMLAAVLMEGCRISSVTKTNFGKTDKQHLFQNAMARLAQENIIGGADNGWGGPYGFYTLFGDVFRYGSESDFARMCDHNNPVVRAMGLLCLKYIDHARAWTMAQQVELNSQMVRYRNKGDMGVMLNLGDIVLLMFSEDNFCDTLSVAKQIIDEKNGITIKVQVYDTNDVVIKVH